MGAPGLWLQHMAKPPVEVWGDADMLPQHPVLLVDSASQREHEMGLLQEQLWRFSVPDLSPLKWLSLIDLTLPPNILQNYKPYLVFPDKRPEMKEKYPLTAERCCSSIAPL